MLRFWTSGQADGEKCLAKHFGGKAEFQTLCLAVAKYLRSKGYEYRLAGKILPKWCSIQENLGGIWQGGQNQEGTTTAGHYRRGKFLAQPQETMLFQCFGQFGDNWPFVIKRTETHCGMDIIALGG